MTKLGPLHKRTPGDGRVKNLTPALSMASRMRRTP
jgi:hypothetical protein